MAQLTLYLKDEAHSAVREAAEREGLSLSKWASKHLLSAAKSTGWPTGFFDLFGSIDDESFSEPAELDAGDDGHLEAL